MLDFSLPQLPARDRGSELETERETEAQCKEDQEAYISL